MTNDLPPKLSEKERSDLDNEIIVIIRDFFVTSASSLVVRNGKHFRLVDKSLQRLRKQGRIEYASPIQGWKLTNREKSHGTA
jgi:hypothetical protein